MVAGARLILAAIHGAADGVFAGIVEDEIGVAAGAIEPAIDSPAGLSDRGADSPLGGFAVGVGGCSGDVLFARQTVAQLLLSLSDVLAENVSAGALVLR